jgi:hypothetical protein
MEEENRQKAKISFLINDIQNEFLKLNNFEEMEREVQEKTHKLFSKVGERLNIECKPEFENLLLYSNYQKELFQEGRKIDLTLLKPLFGHEKEFEDTKNNLTNCLKSFDIMKESISWTGLGVGLITAASKEKCLDECRSDIISHKLQERDARRCISACFRFLKNNLETSQKLLLDKIKEHEVNFDKFYAKGNSGAYKL